MTAPENWIYGEASYQTNGKFSDRQHKVTHIIPNISSQSRTNYKQQLKNSFRLISDLFQPKTDLFSTRALI